MSPSVDLDDSGSPNCIIPPPLHAVSAKAMHTMKMTDMMRVRILTGFCFDFIFSPLLPSGLDVFYSKLLIIIFLSCTHTTEVLQLSDIKMYGSEATCPSWLNLDSVSQASPSK